MDLKHAVKVSLPGRMAIRVYNHFDTVPAAIPLKNYWFYLIANVAYTLSWIVHATWMVVFYYIGLYTMMEIQLVSIALYVCAIICNRRGLLLAGMIIGMSEAAIHQLFAVHLLGWDAGFQYLLPVIALFPFLKHDEAWYVKSILVISGMCVYLYINIYMKNLVPVFHISATYTSFFNISNTLLCFIIIANWGIVLSIAYRRTVKVLMKQEQELHRAEKAKEQAEMQQQLELKERDNEIYRLRNIELKNSHDEIELQNRIIEEEKRRSQALLLNILPEETAGSCCGKAMQPAGCMIK